MTINRTTFFAYARRAPFGGKLLTAQVEGMTAILDAWEKLRFSDHRWLAYALATTFHETGGTMQPVREAHGKSDAQSIARLDAEWAKPGHGALRLVKEPYWRDGYFARGYPGLTHEENYRKAGDLVGVDLVANPGRAMEPELSAKILLVGMAKGIFRRTKDGRPETFDRHFGNVVSDPVGARAIINGGGDKAKLIASHFTAFHAALLAANEMVAQPDDVKPQDALPDDKPLGQSGTAIVVGTATAGGCITAAGGVATAAIGGISNQWALIGFGLLLLFLLIAGGVGLWLVSSGRLAILRGKAVA